VHCVLRMAKEREASLYHYHVWGKKESYNPTRSLSKSTSTVKKKKKIEKAARVLSRRRKRRKNVMSPHPGPSAKKGVMLNPLAAKKKRRRGPRSLVGEGGRYLARRRRKEADP